MRAARRNFAAYAWSVLGYNLLVVVWGAFVRATGSGAGCGSHWPLCNGDVVPRGPQVATVIEFTHRATSGIALLAVAGLAAWAFRAFPKGHRARLGALLSCAFIVTEALIGAGLVLFEHVAKNASVARGFSLSLHLINTFALIGALALTAWWASGGPPASLSGGGRSRIPLASALAGLMLLGVSGAITALGDTLFPASTFAAGVRQDLSSGAHVFVRLRVFHPAIAVAAIAFLIWVVARAMKERGAGRARSLGFAVIGLALLQMMLGVANLVLLAPIWMQLVHLLAADLLWIAAVLFSAGAWRRFRSRDRPRRAY